MVICCPVMLAAPSDSRKDVVAATSSGLTRRPIGGIFGTTDARRGSLSIGVSVAPGATTFTVIRRGASSIANERAIPTTAALVAAYCARPGEPAAVRLPEQDDAGTVGKRGDQRLDDLLGRVDMQPPHLARILRIEFSEVSHAEDAGCMDDGVERREILQRRCERRAVEEIDRPVGEPFRRKRRLAAAEADHVPALREQPLRSRLTDAGTDAGHERASDAPVL